MAAKHLTKFAGHPLSFALRANESPHSGWVETLPVFAKDNA